MATISVLTYHCSVFIWYFFLAYLLFSVSPKDPPAGVFLYGGQWKYLTVLNVVLQTLFYAVSFLTDLLLPIRGIKLVKFVIYCKDLIFSVLAFPASTFVFLSFWALYTYDRQLVYPEGLDKVIPLWLNHAVVLELLLCTYDAAFMWHSVIMGLHYGGPDLPGAEVQTAITQHTAVFPIAVLEIVTSPHHYPPKRKGLTLLGICSVAYLSWVLWIYIADGNWVYPFLGLLNPVGFILFLLSSNILAALVYIAGDTLNYLVWGEARHKRMKS